MKSTIAAAGLVAVSQAFTQPVQPPTYGSLLTPDVNTPVTTGQDYQITWTPKQPAAGVTVSLVLCNGPSTNCVLQNTAIVEGVPAAQGSYKWSVPCSLPAGVQSTATGYGMLIIVDGTGEFQYSTQFSVQPGASCSSSTTSSASTTTITTSSLSSSTTTTTTSTTSVSSPTTSSVSTTSSSSSVTSSTVTTGWDDWNNWNSTSLLTTTVPVPTTPSAYTTAPVASTFVPSSPVVTSPTGPTGVTPFTGAAAVPKAFVNVAGIFGVAGLIAVML